MADDLSTEEFVSFLRARQIIREEQIKSETAPVKLEVDSAPVITDTAATSVETESPSPEETNHARSAKRTLNDREEYERDMKKLKRERSESYSPSFKAKISQSIKEEVMEMREALSDVLNEQTIKKHDAEHRWRAAQTEKNELSENVKYLNQAEKTSKSLRKCLIGSEEALIAEHKILREALEKVGYKKDIGDTVSKYSHDDNDSECGV